MYISLHLNKSFSYRQPSVTRQTSPPHGLPEIPEDDVTPVDLGHTDDVRERRGVGEAEKRELWLDPKLLKESSGEMDDHCAPHSPQYAGDVDHNVHNFMAGDIEVLTINCVKHGQHYLCLAEV